MKIVTGATGQAHVTAADDGALHTVLFDKMYDSDTGTVSATAGTYVLPIGDVLKAEAISASKIRIKSGDIMMQGRHGRIPHGTYDEVTIENGTTGYNRNDLIVCHYENNDGVESMSLKVLKGTPTTGTAKDPSYTTGNILTGDAEVDYPLYRVKLSGINLEGVDTLFTFWTPASTHTHTMNQISGNLTVDKVTGNWPLSRTTGSLSLDRTTGNLSLVRTTGSLSLSEKTSGVLPLSKGGTGATTAANARKQLFESKPLPVSEGGTGCDGITTLWYRNFNINTYILDNQSIAAGGVAELTYNCGSAGQRILAGFYVSNATSSGTGSSGIATYGAYVTDDGDKFVVKCKNTGSKAAKVKVGFKILECKEYYEC